MLASIGHSFLVPNHMTDYEWEFASIHEKGTAVEALIGRQFIKDNSHDALGNNNIISLSAPLSDIAYSILDALEGAVHSSAQQFKDTTSSLSPNSKIVGIKNP